MNRIGRNSLLLIALMLVAGLVGAGVVLAGDDSDDRIRVKNRSRIVIIDDDGNRHEEFFDDDSPRPYLGVVLDGTDGLGARVDHVLEDTAAERFGLLEGDIIVGFDNEEIESPWDLTRKLMRSEPGQRVDVEILRDGSTEHLSVEVGEREHAIGYFGHGFDSDEFEEKMEMLNERLEGLEFEFDGEEFTESMEQLHERLQDLDLNFDFNFDLDDLDFDFDDGPHGKHGAWFMRSSRPVLGVELVDTTPELRRHLGSDGDTGVLVGKVIDDMPAELADVRVGDLIVAVDGEAIENTGDLRRALRDRRGDVFDLEVVRDGRTTVLSVELPEAHEHDDVEGSRGRHQDRQRRERSAADNT
jgi:C-terminal processing protease CtpA/Prc